ncbi:MAG TPA: TonB-dependent receptor [Pusillimonas sp.]|uniref:TonB-dependent receptor domain-containing protein n=1 Tax=Pusillimonas sp. TaxID=3040095 RepID=UPI002BBCD4A3|nr:TonB-dependent receptor [Pusillimonas sp.]HUH87610.1 TonB-dependent receptor [Pusillimonas sp.]
MHPGICGVALCAAVAYQPILAQTVEQAVMLDAVTISAGPLGVDMNALASPADFVSGTQLMLKRQATLGATLSGLPGVHADTFGGGASRPVIRGQTAPRVSVLSDGALVMDASAVSPDHMVAVEPMLAHRIEVLRGPSTLLYGGGAIGGVVNVIDSRVPRHVPQEGPEGFMELNAATGARSRSGAFGITAGQNNFAVHIEAMKRRADDYRVPDWNDSHVSGTHAKSSTGSAGMSWVGDSGYLGLAYSQTESRYGLPGHAHEYEDCHPHGAHLHCTGHDHDHDESHDDHDHEGGSSAPYVRMKTQRLDLRGELQQPFSGIRKLSMRGGFTDYRHREIEHNTVATTFTNRGYDMRLEAEHEPLGGWRGVVGTQVSNSEFAALGQESFLPQTQTRNVGVFVLEEYRLGAWRFELGARHDWQSVRPQNDQASARFQGASVSGAAVWDLAPQYSAALTLSRSSRLPSAQELYADGVHLATNTYELGNPALKKETSQNIDLTLRKHEGDWRLGLSLFYNRVSDYIFARTLDRHEDFRLIEYSQADATFMGAEANLDYRVNRHLTAGVFGDVVRAQISGDGGHLPRIPAARAGARVKLQSGGWSGDLEFYRVFRQNRLAAYEDGTPGYNMANASVSYDYGAGSVNYTIYLRADNLFDQLAYNHASFIKAAAPLPGRQLMLGVRIEH